MTELSLYQRGLSEAQWLQIRQLSEQSHPLEACGFVLNGGAVISCENVATDEDTFQISAVESAQYIDEALCVWHSHRDYHKFSEADIKACKALNLPYAMWDCGGSFAYWLDPSQDAGLLQRPWAYGVHDCYSSVRDWFHQEMGLNLNDYPRLYEGEWRSRGFTHFEDNFAAEGFLKLPHGEPLQRGDVVFMRIANDSTTNHVAVIQDPEQNLIFQHCIGRYSGLTLFSDYWRARSFCVVRYSGG